MVVEITNLSFTYFDLMGKGEVARILLNYGGEQFEEHRLPVTVFNPETWPALKEEMKLPFGQLPILKFETNGKKVTLAQSRAIEFFLASRYGLMPECDLDRSLVLQYLLGIDDMRANLVPIFHEKDPLKKEELMKVMITNNILPFLSRYNNFLKENGTGFLVSNKLSLADVATYQMMWFIIKTVKIETEVTYPDLHNFFQTIGNIEKIKSYLNIRPNTPW